MQFLLDFMCRNHDQRLLKKVSINNLYTELVIKRCSHIKLVLYKPIKMV